MVKTLSPSSPGLSALKAQQDITRINKRVRDIANKGRAPKPSTQDPAII